MNSVELELRKLLEAVSAKVNDLELRVESAECTIEALDEVDEKREVRAGLEARPLTGHEQEDAEIIFAQADIIMHELETGKFKFTPGREQARIMARSLIYAIEGIEYRLSR